jgi:hypothetical protein
LTCDFHSGQQQLQFFGGAGSHKVFVFWAKLMMNAFLCEAGTTEGQWLDRFLGLVLYFLVKIAHIVSALGMTLLELYHARFASLIAALDHAPESRLIKGGILGAADMMVVIQLLFAVLAGITVFNRSRQSVAGLELDIWRIELEILAARIEKRALRFVGFLFSTQFS